MSKAWGLGNRIIWMGEKGLDMGLAGEASVVAGLCVGEELGPDGTSLE